MNTAIRCMVAGLILCSASAATAQLVQITASGRVSTVEDPERFLPGSIRNGAPVMAEVHYRVEDATGGPFTENRALYEFPAGRLQLTMSIGQDGWRCSNILSGHVNVDNDVPTKDTDYFIISVEDNEGVFPYAVPENRGLMTVGFQDRTIPLTMLQSLALPGLPGDVDFRQATFLYADLYSQGNDGQYWHIRVTLDTADLVGTVAVQETTWGVVKRLYD